MTSQDAFAITESLAKRFPDSAPPTAEADLFAAGLMLLVDRRVAATAAREIAEHSDRFPSIGEFRQAYRSVAERETGVRSPHAGRPPQDEPTDEIPEWVHVWYWQLKRTRLERQVANEKSRQPVAERAPAKMRDFPQYERPGPDAYSPAEYEALRAEWVAAGSPRAGSAEEIVAAAAG